MQFIHSLYENMCVMCVTSPTSFRGKFKARVRVNHSLPSLLVAGQLGWNRRKSGWSWGETSNNWHSRYPILKDLDRLWEYVGGCLLVVFSSVSSGHFFKEHQKSYLLFCPFVSFLLSSLSFLPSVPPRLIQCWFTWATHTHTLTP